MMIRALVSLVAAILFALASVTVDAQDDTVVRVDYVAVLVQADDTESPYAEGVHYIASDGRYRRDETPAGGTPDVGVPAPPRRRPRLRESLASRGRAQWTHLPCQRRVARRPQPCHAAGGRRDDGDRREDAGSDWTAGSRGGPRGVRAYGVLGARPAHDGDGRGSARVSADRRRDDHLHGHRRALRGSSDLGSTHSVRAGHLHGSRSCPLSSTVFAGPCSTPGGQSRGASRDRPSRPRDARPERRKRDHGNAPTAHRCAVAADTATTGVEHRGRSWSRIADRDVGHLDDGMPAW